MNTSDSLTQLMETQLKLQTQHMGGDPRHLFADDKDAWATFMTWNNWAMADEMHEAMNEVGWKPWATSRHLNEAEFNKEMVDAFHFFMNLLLAGNPGKSVYDIVRDFVVAYYEKNEKNAQRQIEGYDGVADKCSTCRRELLGGQCAEGHIN